MSLNYILVQLPLFSSNDSQYYGKHIPMFIQCWMYPSSWSLQVLLSSACLAHILPMKAVISSSSSFLPFCLPLFISPPCLSFILFVPLLSFLWAACPAHLHIDCFIFTMIYVILVCFPMAEHLILSRDETCSICRFIVVLADWSLLCEYLVFDLLWSMSLSVEHIDYKSRFAVT